MNVTDGDVPGYVGALKPKGENRRPCCVILVEIVSRHGPSEPESKTNHEDERHVLFKYGSYSASALSYSCCYSYSFLFLMLFLLLLFLPFFLFFILLNA